MIPFNIPPQTGQEKEYINQALETGFLSGGGPFSQRCEKWLENHTSAPKALLTPSCTAALEISALLCNIGAGDEVIVPSYTFVSTANAFALRGAKVIFVDLDPKTMNLSIDNVRNAICERTKAVVPVHYAGVACDMDALIALSETYGFYLIEDAAQGLMSTYKSRALGGIGHLGCFSFHATKNYTSGGEGGALIVNDERLIERAKIIREKGTDRSQFLAGIVDKYTWQDLGSSYLFSELQAAHLASQLNYAEQIKIERLNLWDRYYNGLKELANKGFIELPFVSEGCTHNGHMFYIKLSGGKQRSHLINHLKRNGIQSAFHYIPLHSSPAGKKYGTLFGEDQFTTQESEKLLRLPIWYGLKEKQVDYVIECTKKFWG